jgi:hypothetical protein
VRLTCGRSIIRLYATTESVHLFLASALIFARIARKVPYSLGVCTHASEAAFAAVFGGKRGSAFETERLARALLRGSAFEGATPERLHIAREILHGYRVRYRTSREPKIWQHGIFLNILMPGDYTQNPWSQPYDVIIASGHEHEDATCGGGSHHMGLAAVLELEVTAHQPWGWCQLCNRWRPRSLLDYTFTEFEDEEDCALNAHCLQCRVLDENGNCQ